MARYGVSKEAVFAAAKQLVAEGKDPTIEQVRHILKTGSNSTIACHLRDWRLTQTHPQSLAITEGLPKEIVNIMKGLWQNMTVQAGMDAEALEAKYQPMIAELRRELEKYQSNNRRWQRLFIDWQQEKERLIADNRALEQRIGQLQQDKQALQAGIESQQALLQEKRIRIEELHRLHQQSQANLEHERLDSQTHLANEQTHFQQYKLLMQQELESSKQQIVSLKEQMDAISQTNHALKDQSTELEKQYELVRLSFQAKEQQLVSCENNLQDLSCTLDRKNHELLQTQAELTLSKKQLEDLKFAVNNLQDQNKLLEQEKWLLIGKKQAELLLTGR